MRFFLFVMLFLFCAFISKILTGSTDAAIIGFLASIAYNQTKVGE